MKNTCSINKRLNYFGNFTVVHGALLAVIVTIGVVSCNTAQADDDYRSLIVASLVSTGGDVVPGPVPPPGPGPVPLKDCPVCKGTGFITHGDGHKTPCPEDHPASELAAHYKRIATMMGGVARARPTVDFSDLAKAGCQCESGGPCTCQDGCDCKDCQCANCPGKTSKQVIVKLCDESGCREVLTTAKKRKDGRWFAKPEGRWVEWKAGKWQKYEGESKTIERPMLWKAQPLSRAPGQHSHRCGVCGNTWSHYPGQSHRCPSCGGLTNRNYVQINSGSSYRPRIAQQPRRFTSRRSSG